LDQLDLIYDRDKRRALLNMVMNIQVPQKVGKLMRI
jgi:hypothetical protein